jgi:aspartate/glutamate racemase
MSVSFHVICPWNSTVQQPEDRMNMHQDTSVALYECSADFLRLATHTGHAACRDIGTAVSAGNSTITHNKEH